MNVEERILKLENQNKRLRFFNYLSVMLVSVLFISGFQQQLQLPDIIKAKGFILLDDNNKERAILTIDTSQNRNSPKLRFYNEDNKIITSIGANENSGYLSLSELNKDKTIDSSSFWIDGNGFRLKYNEEKEISLGVSDYESSLNIRHGNEFIKLGRQNYYSLLDRNDYHRYGIMISHFNTDKKEENKMNFVNYNYDGDDILDNDIFLGHIFVHKDNDSYSKTSGLSFNINKKYIYKNMYDKNNISTKYYDENNNLRLSIGNTEIQYSDGTNQIITPTSSIYLFNENGNVIEQLPR